MDKTKKKLVAMWVMFALQIIPAIFCVGFTVANIPSGWDSLRFLKNSFSVFEVRDGIALWLGLFSALAVIAILAIGRKETFGTTASVLTVLPYILSGIAVFCIPAHLRTTAMQTAIEITFLIGAILILISQIYLIVKLSKATKQLKA